MKREKPGARVEESAGDDAAAAYTRCAGSPMGGAGARRGALGMATPELMEELLSEKVEINDYELRRLITARARWIMNWLAQSGKVSGDGMDRRG